MGPTLETGDIIIFKPINKRNIYLKEGDIVIARHPLTLNRLIIKRLLRIEKNGYFLIGDNRDSSIDSRHFGIINPKKIIGIAEKAIQSNTFKVKIFKRRP